MSPFPSRAVALGRPALAAALAIVLVTSGCAGPRAPTIVPTGTPAGSEAPVTLRVANGEGAGSPESDAVLYFADEVARASGGSVTVEPIDDEQADVDNDNRVASGEIDAAITQARSWDALDVTSLQALQTPFLVTNETIAASATDGDLAARLMGGLTDKGVDGLALWPIDFRHPVSFGEPFLSLADFKGAQIRIVGSTITEDVMRALGAEAVRPEGDWLDKIKDGTIKGAESAFDRVGTLPKIGTATGNVTFYPRVDAFFINHAAFAALSAAQQTAVREAAAATRQHVIDGIVPDATQAAAYCSENGGTVVLASDADLAAMAAALEPVRTKLEGDPLTKQLIADIAKVAAGVAAPASVSACAPPATDVLDGTWHTDTLTEKQLVDTFVAAGGAADEGRAFYHQLGGGATDAAVIGVGFDHGSFTQFEAGDSGQDLVGDRLGYSLEADGILTLKASDCTQKYAVSIDGNDLRMTLVEGCPNWPYGPSLYATAPFHRDGGAASTIPAGTYTTIATKEDALRIPWDDDCALKLDGGHISLELDAGKWTESESCKDHPKSVGSHGTYTSTADTFVLKDCCDGSTSTFTWQLDGTRLTLRLTDVAGGDESTERVIRFIYEHEFEHQPAG